MSHKTSKNAHISTTYLELATFRLDLNYAIDSFIGSIDVQLRRFENCKFCRKIVQLYNSSYKNQFFLSRQKSAIPVQPGAGVNTPGYSFTALQNAISTVCKRSSQKLRNEAS